MEIIEVYVTTIQSEAIHLKRTLDEEQIWAKVVSKKTKYGGDYWTVEVDENHFFNAIEIRKEIFES